jgi:ABC-type multidrug transport system fused ATPase/permease subunit
LDSDKVLVLDEGQVVEFGPPQELLKREGGAFRGLVHGHAK